MVERRKRAVTIFRCVSPSSPSTTAWKSAFRCTGLPLRVIVKSDLGAAGLNGRAQKARGHHFQMCISIVAIDNGLEVGLQMHRIAAEGNSEIRSRRRGLEW